MKISNILIALSIVFAVACSGKKSESDHGHSHPEGEGTHSHEHETNHEQEEFSIKGDTLEVGTDSARHTHEDGSTHHNH